MATKEFSQKRFHVDIETGKIGYCNATIKTCPYGGENGDAFHYDTRQDAVMALENFYEQEYEYLGEGFKKNIDNTKNAPYFHMDMDERAANLTDALADEGFPAKVAGKGKVRLDLKHSNPERPGDEFGDLTAMLEFNDSEGRRYSGTWMLSSWSPKNSWYGSSRLLYSGPTIRGLDEAGLRHELKKLMDNPDAAVAAMRANDKFDL